MSVAPRGFYVFCGSVTCAAAAVIAVNLLHHGAAVLPQASGSHPAVAVSPSASAAVPRVSLPGSAPAMSAPTAVQVARVSVASRPARPSPPAPSPMPRPSPAGGAAQVAAVVSAPLRGGAPVSVKVSVTIPGEPPWPTPGLGVVLP